ncbi:hypothetical protein ROHU_010985 [Labeo rohita]|uniref:DUF7869 domain-containing protein n=1 Tax=Labeo rohita TaxID=84645 RepID=A0A498LW92_LABRO|nr:hypothetical protein ROHU_010985 [Labeo rohita]
MMSEWQPRFVTYASVVITFHYYGKVCKETCPRQCPSLTDERKLQLFTEFYAVSYERQQAIILSSLEQFWLYRDIFKQQNLSFGQPRSDTCAKCGALFSKLTAATTDGERLKIATESELHHRKAEKAYTQLQADTEWAKANKDCHVICIDMQGVVYTPNLTHSNVYYQRQLANYNLCIQEMGTDNPPTMCLWHEGIAHRGSIENNNWRVLNLMALLVSRRYFSQIEQKFMVSGHSFLPCDRSFATLEKRRKVSTLYTPSNVAEMIRGARQQHPFKVIEMACADFRQFPDSTLKRPPGLLITSMMWLKVTAADPWYIHTKMSHSLYEGWKTWLITKQRKNQPPPAPLFSSPRQEGEVP